MATDHGQGDEVRHAAKVDANHAEIVAALRAVGAQVQSLAMIGAGCPDLLVLYRGTLVLMEVKDGSLPPSHRRLTPLEAQFFTQWSDGPVYLVESVDDALNAIDAA